MPFLLGYDSMHCCAEDVDDRDTHFLGGKWGLCTLKDIWPTNDFSWRIEASSQQEKHIWCANNGCLSGKHYVGLIRKAELLYFYAEPLGGDPLFSAVAKADVNQRKGPFGLPALSACILRPLAPEGIALMIDAQADVKLNGYQFEDVWAVLVRVHPSKRVKNPYTWSIPSYVFGLYMGYKPRSKWYWHSLCGQWGHIWRLSMGYTLELTKFERETWE